MSCTTTLSSKNLLRPGGVDSVLAVGHTSDSAVDWSSLPVYPFPPLLRAAPTIHLPSAGKEVKLKNPSHRGEVSIVQHKHKIAG